MNSKEDKIKYNLKDVTIIIVYIFCVNEQKILVNGHKKEDGLIYILEWTDSRLEPFRFMAMGQRAFTFRECAYQNCFLTDDVEYFDHITDFDVLLMGVKSLNESFNFPHKRKRRQKYVFVALESSVNYPLGDKFNNVFNLTWTYKLDSDAPLGYIIVKNRYGEIIGPKKDMHWLDINKMKPISKYIKRKLRNKNTAAAWFVSNCNATNNRSDYIDKLSNELSLLEHSIDIYGDCGNYNCTRDDMVQQCFAKIESDFYFYLAFENSFCEDYVTEKILNGLEHFSVPVVYGGGNYSRFIPKGIYLDANLLTPKELAKTMVEAIDNIDKYYNFFKWHRYYSFHSTEEYGFTDEICALCKLLNDNMENVYVDFVNWWNK